MVIDYHDVAFWDIFTNYLISWKFSPSRLPIPIKHSCLFQFLYFPFITFSIREEFLNCHFKCGGKLPTNLLHFITDCRNYFKLQRVSSEKNGTTQKAGLLSWRAVIVGMQPQSVECFCFKLWLSKCFHFQHYRQSLRGNPAGPWQTQTRRKKKSETQTMNGFTSKLVKLDTLMTFFCSRLYTVIPLIIICLILNSEQT